MRALKNAPVRQGYDGNDLLWMPTTHLEVRLFSSDVHSLIDEKPDLVFKGGLAVRDTLIRPASHSELARVRVTLQLLWGEYESAARQRGVRPY